MKMGFAANGVKRGRGAESQFQISTRFMPIKGINLRNFKIHREFVLGVFKVFIMSCLQII
jgi:hypothetical protein